MSKDKIIKIYANGNTYDGVWGEYYSFRTSSWVEGPYSGEGIMTYKNGDKSFTF